MEQSVVLNYLFLFFGTVIFIAALVNWDYFFELRKAKIIVKSIGRNGARILYGLLGLLFIFIALNFFLGLQLF